MALPIVFKQEYVDVAKLPYPIPTSPTPVNKAHSDVIQCIRQERIRDAKILVRTQHWTLDQPNRGDLWLKLCQHYSKGYLEPDFYQNTLKSCLWGVWPMNLPAFADPIFCEDYLLSAEGQKHAERVLYVVSISHPYITYCPLLHPVASLLLHYLSEEEVYECVCALIENTTVRHLSQTRLMHDTSAYTLMQLTRRLAKKTYSRLRRKVEQEEDLEKIFHTWELWIFRGLPLYHLVRSMDCFLLEGVRALYRIAMAILILFTQDLSLEDTPGDSTSDTGSFLDKIIVFCKQIPYNVDRFLKTAYNIQGFSAKLLNQQLLKSEMYIKSCSSRRLRAASESGLPGSCYHLDVTSAYLSVKESKNRGERAMSVGIIPLANFRSEILSAEQVPLFSKSVWSTTSCPDCPAASLGNSNVMALVWSWLPARITMLQPEVIYSTNEHGSSLTNFFFHTDTWEPTLLVILTTREERFGAYCSTRWQERNQTYFGTGETFLFTFVPEPRRYTWVGVGSTQDVPPSSSLFISANQHMIQIGGGNGMALYIDESMENGRSEHCDTFDNRSLASSDDFVVRILEVIGFA
ncbi:GTPase-activating protein skywalker-like isoform X2 [Dermacentor variabilis]|uniref:GTPase-activating protein skywalker-like isoform X2 n=1 Tax=Dermacentor variabilis TaxID=34621 RepID=UPI003F5C4054